MEGAEVGTAVGVLGTGTGVETVVDPAGVGAGATEVVAGLDDVGAVVAGVLAGMEEDGAGTTGAVVAALEVGARTAVSASFPDEQPRIEKMIIMAITARMSTIAMIRPLPFIIRSSF